MSPINPYNFVDLPAGKPDRGTGHPKFHRLTADRYSGELVCELKALTDIITLGQLDPVRYVLKDEKGEPLLDRDQEQITIKTYYFCKNGVGTPIIRGTSLKGMIRSVYEAMTGSCLPLICTDKANSRKVKDNYSYQQLTDYSISDCMDEALCPGCRLFGVQAGSELSYKGRLSFSDAELFCGMLSAEKRNFLKILSNPKPRHAATYSKTGFQNGPIAGRKFYYHHNPGIAWKISEWESNGSGIGVDEVASPGTKFRFRLLMENLSCDEFKDLIAALELSPGMGHKLGLGKPIGLGSCQIRIIDEECAVNDGLSRYQKFDCRKLIRLDSFRQNPLNLPPTLEEILRLNKPHEGSIGYPDFNNYPKTRIDALGFFKGQATTPGKALSIEHGENTQAQTEIWKDSVLGWNKGNQTLTASIDKKKASAKGSLKIPEPYWSQLNGNNKRRPVSATITVEKLGNAFKIIEIEGCSISQKT